MYEIRRAVRGDVSGLYHSTEVLQRKRDLRLAQGALLDLAGGGSQPGLYPAKELGIFDTAEGRWVRGYMPRALSI